MKEQVDHPEVPEVFFPDSTLELLKTSPEGLRQLGSGLLEKSCSPKGVYNDNSRWFKAGSELLEKVPEVFMELSEEEQELKQLKHAFWKHYFKAKVQGAEVPDFETIVNRLDKKQMNRIARYLINESVRAKDLNSFEVLLKKGACRRSKLVMFSV